MIDLYQSKGRKEWVDLGKGISMLLILLFHCEVYLSLVDTGTEKIFSFFRTSFFFFLSGYVFTSNYKEFSLARKLRQILRGIVWTYFVITSIIVLPKYMSNGEPIIDGIGSIIFGRASWFIVSLGVAQLMFALVLSRVKNLKVIALFMVLSVAVGVGIKSITSGTLPYQLDKAFFVVFFFGMGFFYRIYEDRLKAMLKWKFLILAVAVYASLMVVENVVLHSSTTNVFWGQPLCHFPLFMVYTIIGILMMLLLVNKLSTKHLHFVCYVGSNSLLFYYLNGGVIKCWRAVYGLVAAHIQLNAWLSFILVFVMVTATLTVIVFMVKKYCPILVGDKNSFNRCFPKYKW